MCDAGRVNSLQILLNERMGEAGDKPLEAEYARMPEAPSHELLTRDVVSGQMIPVLRTEMPCMRYWTEAPNISLCLCIRRLRQPRREGRGL